MSIHADDEFSLRIALESELDDVVPCDGLADIVIARYRKSHRRRVVGAVGLIIVVGIGVPLGLTRASGGPPSRSGSVVLHLDPYHLRLAHGYHASHAQAAPCAAVTRDLPAPGEDPDGRPDEVAAASSGGCVLMLLTAPFSASAGHGDPHIPAGSAQVTVAGQRAWLVPASRPGEGADGPDGASVVIPSAAGPGASGRDLVIGASGLSPAALVNLVSESLSRPAAA